MRERAPRHVRAKPRFLIVGGYSESLVRFRLPLILGMVERGYEVHAAAGNLVEDAPTRSRLEGLGVRCHSFPVRRNEVGVVSDLKTLLSLMGLCRRVRPDKVLCYTIKPVVYGLVAARLTGIRARYALITGAGYAFGAFASGPVTWLAGVLYRLALHGLRSVIFQNAEDLELFRDRRILSPGARVAVVPGSGVDLEFFSPASLPESARPKFLLIARLLRSKGVREYVAAARIVRAEWPDVEFDLVGWLDSGPDSITEAELEQWTGEGVIRFVGRLEDVRSAISSCTVYVLPSYREGMPRTVLEAMAMGRAVITTDAPGCRDTVKDGVNGFLVPVGNVDELAERMIRFVADESLAPIMGANSRAMAVDRFGATKVADLMLEEMR